MAKSPRSWRTNANLPCAKTFSGEQSFSSRGFSLDSNERKGWFTLAVGGTVFMGMCIAVSIIQYFVIKISAPMFIQKYVAIFINLVSFFGFVALIFYPTNFNIHFIIFYIYGIGNLLDSGNILGALCIFIAALFFKRLGHLRKHRSLKTILLLIPPAAALFSQIYTQGAVHFLISVFHIVGLGIIIGVLYLFFYKQINSIQILRTSIEIPENECTDEELEWLSMLARGEKYISISKKFNISESKVKQRILELYKIIGVHDKMEFMTAYRSCQFTHKKD